MKLKHFIVCLLVSAQAHSFQLRDDSDFDWITGCEMSQEGFDYNLVYEDIVKKSNPGNYYELINDPEFKRKTFDDIKRAKESGYLCTPIAVLTFDIKMTGYDNEITGFKISQENFSTKYTVKNVDFRNLPDSYKIELMGFTIPQEIGVASHKVHQILQRCPEIKVESTALLEVGVLFSRKDSGVYVGVPSDGRISAYCQLMPKGKMELISFKYSTGA